MKRLMYAAMLLLGLSVFCSCSKEGGSTKDNLASTIVGTWIFTDDEDLMDAWFQFSESGIVTRFDISYKGDDDNLVSYDNGVLTVKPLVYWTEGPSWQYSFQGNNLFAGGMFWGNVQIVNKNKLIIGGGEEVDYKGTLERILQYIGQ